MNVTLSIDSTDSMESIKVSHSELATIVGWLNDDFHHARFFSRLIDHPASEVRSALACMSSSSVETLENLARDASIEVVRQVASRKRALKAFKFTLIEEMINRDVSVASEIADNLSNIPEGMCKKVIEVLLQHSDPKVVETTESYVERSKGDEWEDEDID